ncbi:MAG: TlpA family protein disulfide reductase [Algicola sp.]|nr:TlpA family protein disulfide reductase [Algicola sp.]
MAKTKAAKITNAIFIILLVLLIIPQTRKPIQVVLNKGMALFMKPKLIDTSKQVVLSDYHWKLQTIEGETFDFHSVKGKVVVLNFWATWCPPCIAEMPSMEALYQRYEFNDEVVFMFVSNEDVEVLQKFLVSKSYTFPVYQPVSTYPEAFNVSSIPRTFVLDKNGAIVIDKLGVANWSSDEVIETIDNLTKAF